MALPILAAIGTGLSAINTVSSLFGGSNSSSGTNAATASGSAGTATQLTAAEQGDRFLKLLVTQMRNQDPLNPLDNAQVTTQMAQISTVTGVDKLNTGIEKLSQSLLSAQSLQSAGVIGHQVLAAGSTLSLSATGANGALELAQSADRVQVTIATPAGAVLRRLELGAQPGGVVNFQWDGLTDAGGRATPGSYIFQVTAVSGNQSIAATPLVAGKVTGVSLNNSNLQLSIEGVGDLPAANVLRIQ